MIKRHEHCVSARDGETAMREMLAFFEKTVGVSLVSSCPHDSEPLTRSEARHIAGHPPYALTNRAAECLFVHFVLCLSQNKIPTVQIDRLSREFARLVVLVLVAQRKMGDFVSLPAGGFCGFPSPQEILQGEIL